MMFSCSVVLRSAVMVAFASSLNLSHLVDDADISSGTPYMKVHGATLEPLSECPATDARTFHHDGLQKDRHAEATFHFDPPRDGCYLIEERTEIDAKQWKEFQSKECEPSANTKVHVQHGKGLQAVGTLDQTTKGFAREAQDQWTFIAAMDFYAGHPGKVRLSNEGTKPGTLTMFDQVRFSWSGENCAEIHAQPRRAEMRITVDFQHVANRLTVFGMALKKMLTKMAKVPEFSVRLTGLRAGSGVQSGSIVAEFLVLPSVEDTGLDVSSARKSFELLRSAVSKNAAKLCAISGGSLRGSGCNVDLEDLGFAIPSVKAEEEKSISEKSISEKSEASFCYGKLQNEASFCYGMDNASTPEQNVSVVNAKTCNGTQGF